MTYSYGTPNSPNIEYDMDMFTSNVHTGSPELNKMDINRSNPSNQPNQLNQPNQSNEQRTFAQNFWDTDQKQLFGRTLGNGIPTPLAHSNTASTRRFQMGNNNFGGNSMRNLQNYKDDGASALNANSKYAKPTSLGTGIETGPNFMTNDPTDQIV